MKNNMMVYDPKRKVYCVVRKDPDSVEDYVNGFADGFCGVGDALGRVACSVAKMIVLVGKGGLGK